MKVSLIYVNYNTQRLLESSLRSVKTHLSNFPAEVIVVDNASPAFDKKSLLDIDSRVILIENDQNVGFGQANNIAACHAKGDILWLLNTDTLIPADHQLEALLDYIQQHEDCAAASPLLTNPEGIRQPSQATYFPTPTRILLNKPVKLARHLLQRKDFGEMFMIDVANAHEADVDVVGAASLFVKKTAFDQVAGFSPGFFMYYEDVDLCQKLHRIGYRIRFFPDARVVHFSGRSLTSKRARKRFYFQSQDMYVEKWFGTLPMLLVKCARQPFTMYQRLKK